MHTVGDHIDLTYMNKNKNHSRRAREGYDKFMAGTKLTFTMMASGIMLMSIVEASGQLKISFT